jgi:hypothetical protein
MYMIRDITVGIAAQYGLDGPEIEYRGGGLFSQLFKALPWCPPTLLHNVYRVIPGGKSAGTWHCPPTHI